MNLNFHECPSCGSNRISFFHQVKDVPVNSMVVLTSRENALNCPKGEINLGFCHSCGFITNTTYDSVPQYAKGYEETQSYSKRFVTFHEQLAEALITKHDLHQKQLVEIGCGKGEFLELLCDLGQNKGIGFDPAYVSGRQSNRRSGHVSFVADFFSTKYFGLEADFVCCKMALEHIPDTFQFLKTIKEGFHRGHTIFFFQVPDVSRILTEVAFWDIYYEHCSYFSTHSLRSLFERCGFKVLEQWKAYGEQYLMITAVNGFGAHRNFHSTAELQKLENEVSFFSNEYEAYKRQWLGKLRQMRRSGKRSVLWGGGSKAVAFLTTLAIGEELECVVDINPFRQGTYIAGTGQKIVAPELLREYQPDVIIVMNGIYFDEIKQLVNGMDLRPEIICV